MSKRKRIDLDFQQVLCVFHGEPFRLKWPQGYPTACTMLMDLITEIPFEELEDPVTKLLDPVKLRDKLIRQPLCCRASEELILKVYKDSRIGDFKLCPGCQTIALGTEIRYIDNNEIRTLDHICFRCYLNSKA